MSTREKLNQEKVLKHIKEKNNSKNKMNLFRNLKKEVNHGANGTQDYVIKEGVNANKTAKQIREKK